MTTTNNTFAETTIVAFHIGRGGHFHNAGYLSFLGEERISKYTGDLFLTREKAYEVGKKIDGRPNLQKALELALEGDDDKVAFFSKIGLDLGELCYADCGGNKVGLTYEEELTGVGRINIDGKYDTTYTRYLSDCNKEELELIANYSGYVDENIIEYALEKL